LPECALRDCLLLTKRIGNAPKMLPMDWGTGLPNVWLGISVVNQEGADRDIRKLLATPARVRFLSMEPLLGLVDLTKEEGWLQVYLINAYGDGKAGDVWEDGIDWVIVGGESGPGARPMHHDWVRSIRDQCVAAGVPFHFKQWGEWQITYDRDVDDPDWRPCPKSEVDRERCLNLEGGNAFHGDRVCLARRVGKKAAGRQLDGREWNELPSDGGGRNKNTKHKDSLNAKPGRSELHERDPLAHVRQSGTERLPQCGRVRHPRSAGSIAEATLMHSIT
jgi:protein gp37